MKPFLPTLLAFFLVSSFAVAQSDTNLTAPLNPSKGPVGSNPQTDVYPQTPRGTVRNPGEILPRPDRTTPEGTTIAGSLDTSRVVSIIEAQNTDTRPELLKEVQQREAEADRQIQALRSSASDLKGDYRAAFDRAMSDYTNAKRRLDAAIAAGRDTDEKTWDLRRSDIAAEYGFFASAAGSVEIAATDARDASSRPNI